jgi:glycosyltransferase involved in cell wall biosynthesis
MNSLSTGPPRPLRVLLDGRYIGDAPTGIGWYTLHLAVGLAEAGVDPLLLGPTPETLGRLLRVAPSQRLRVIPERTSVLSPAGQLRLRAHAREAGADLYHCPYLPFPLGGIGLPGVVTIHDLIPLLLPESVRGTLQGRHPRFLRWLLRRAIRGSARVITVSACTARDLVRLFPEAEGKVRVVPNGVTMPGGTAETEVEAAAAAVDDTLRRLGIERPYVLTVGRRVPYKRIPFLVRAFAGIRDRVDGGLVVVSPPDPRFPEADRLVAGMGLSDRVRFIDYVNEVELGALYRGARFLVHPSAYEGFGLPLLEAMAHGTPVLACRGGAVPEVAGEAAWLVDPDDEAALAEAMVRLWEDAAARERLVRAGEARAREFQWRRTAEATARVYAEIANSASAPPGLG